MNNWMDDLSDYQRLYCIHSCSVCNGMIDHLDHEPPCPYYDDNSYGEEPICDDCKEQEEGE